MKTVWIVLTEESDNEQVILGVFGDPQQADRFMDDIAHLFPDGALAVGSYPVGWRYDRGASRHHT